MTLKPMLATSINLADLPRYLNNDEWWAQMKADGDRVLIEITEGEIRILSRQGTLRTKPVSRAIMAELGRIGGDCVLDGELVADHLVLFDLVSAGSTVTTTSPFEARYEALLALYELWGPQHVIVLPVARTTEEKTLLVKQATDDLTEGVILRRATGHYLSGRRSSHLLKAKFVKEADCIIRAIGIDGHDNVLLSLLDPERLYSTSGILDVGTSSAVGKTPQPAPGQVWEVRFLYVTNRVEPRLVQPRLLRLRTDKAMHECLVDQIANAFTDKTAVLKHRSST